ncbi:copper resistance D family protein [Limobrevibacterium gyesilva]|uniref:CopD family protein n=1 Tax=Limobrevibacterium gyesilva TaxID=2991712 RepID=A0AA41YQ23_9PROT|nr:CopD family protein [Limobrevibacterium gyesilva]MCW3474533.1 CopD family protein [Limobrevibacterium gyesilva]
MALLVDLFGYLSIIIHGLTIVAQSMTLGGVIFLVFLARPRAWLVGDAGAAIERDTARIAAWSAVAFVLCEAATIALEGAVLIGTIDLSPLDVLQAQFALAGLVKIGAAAVLAVLLFTFGPRAPWPPLLAAAAVALAAATMTTHAAARLDDRLPLLAVAALHQLGAAIWIGGIPAFVSALARVHDAPGWRVIGARFSRMSMIGVACILVSGVVMSVLYIGSWDGIYGTAYGVMVGAKVAMFLALLGLGFGNFRSVERLRTDRGMSVTRMKRFAEVEIGVGFSLFFAAASLTSVPPAIDLTQDRVTFHEIVERNRPVWPRFASPDRDVLALPALQAQLDAEAAQQAKKPPPAFVPGSGELPARNAADIAWSEYNHHWAGIFVMLIGLLALLNQAGLRIARHWPLVFLGLAAFLFVRSDPEVWPLGEIGFFDSLRDVEVVQHRFFVLLIVIFGLFEWRVRAGGWKNRGAALVFPLVTAIGGAALLTHSHAIANIKDQLLIELTHTPLALAGIAAGWARWLELRLDPPGNRIAGWIWPVCFLLVALMLLGYREA